MGAREPVVGLENTWWGLENLWYGLRSHGVDSRTCEVLENGGLTSVWFVVVV